MSKSSPDQVQLKAELQAFLVRHGSAGLLLTPEAFARDAEGRLLRDSENRLVALPQSVAENTPLQFPNWDVLDVWLDSDPDERPGVEAYQAKGEHWLDDWRAEAGV